MLSADGVWFRYSDRTPWVVRDFSVTVEPGETAGLAGPSGVGKSTIGRLLAGLLRPDRGRLTGASRRTGPNLVQLVLQHPERAFNPSWKVRDILAESGADEATIDGLDPDLVCPAWHDRFPHEISGGELQRVNLARALLARPRYLIADEITASVDALTQAQIWHLLLDHAAAHDIGVLAISHDRDLLAAVTDRVVELPG
ncbi:ABC transporter ATP-binding protein [Kribbella sp. WER1]